PAGVLVEIMNEDGSMARLPQLEELALRFDMRIVTIKDLIEYRLQTDSLIEEVVGVDMPTRYGHFRLLLFRERNNPNAQEHMALVKGTWSKDESVLVRVHSSCFTGDILGSLRCDCGDQLHSAMSLVEREGKGIVLYMNQEGRGIGLVNKLKAYRLQEQGMDTVEANLHLGLPMDRRDYGLGAQILRSLGVSKIRLISNNPRKRAGLSGYGLEIVENVPLHTPPNPFNVRYLETKRDKMGHEL
ncbi:MAG: GTP cyclohydrolase II, partial [Chitinophagia bacterium]|nr:GTP cyclohydrolase II [Chitinophagia bacterium]